jgi:hypothetical protein
MLKYWEMAGGITFGFVGFVSGTGWITNDSYNLVGVGGRSLYWSYEVVMLEMKKNLEIG